MTSSPAPCGICCLGNGTTLDPSVEVLGRLGEGCLVITRSLTSLQVTEVCCVLFMACLADLAEHQHVLLLASQWWCVCQIKCWSRRDVHEREGARSPFGDSWSNTNTTNPIPCKMDDKLNKGLNRRNAFKLKIFIHTIAPNLIFS